MIECVDHLHEHVLVPVVIDGGRYRVPSRPGHSAHMQPKTLSRFAFPAGGGPVRNLLFICATGAVYAVYVLTNGVKLV